MKNMLSFQKASKTIFLLLLYYFLRGEYDLVHAYSPPYPLCAKNSLNSYIPSKDSLNNLFASLASKASVSKFHNTSSSGGGSDRIYGLYMCFGYTTNEICKDCITSASRHIMDLCHDKTEAVVWEEMCQVRYSNKKFFGSLDVLGNLEQHNPTNISEPEQFASAVKTILSDLTAKAAFDRSPNKYYAAEKREYKDNQNLYAIVQCTGDLSPIDCKSCLQIAIENVSTCCYFYRGARLFSKSCYLRYELYDFYGDESEAQAPQLEWMPGKSKYLQMILLSKV